MLIHTLPMLASTTSNLLRRTGGTFDLYGFSDNKSYKTTGKNEYFETADNRNEGPHFVMKTLYLHVNYSCYLLILIQIYYIYLV